MTDTAAITIESVAKSYRIYEKPSDRLRQGIFGGRRPYFREHAALKPLSLRILRGETVGVVGQNGSGKSTLLQMVCGTLTPTSGRIATVGRISALLELGAGFNPEFTGAENIRLNAAILGLSAAEIADKYEGIVAFSGLDPVLLSRPVKTYSSGMYVRLAFAVAIAVDPDILVVDEALAVGDEAFQRKCYARIARMQERGVTILFVSHAAQTVIELCNRAILLDEGELLLDGEPKEVLSRYHRLIYAPPGQRAAVRASIVSPGTPAPAEDEATPESRVVYTPDGGEILDPRVCDAQGRELREMRYGEVCRFRYRVRFTEAERQVRFAMFLKTRTGLQLAGAICHAAEMGLENIAAGQEIEVCFSFPCLLREGVYYLNCGVTRPSGEGDAFIHRIVDACRIRVAPDAARRAGMEPTGIVDFGITAQLSG